MFGVGGCVFYVDFVLVCVEFFGDDGGDIGIGVLVYFYVFGDYCDIVVWGDL